MNTIGTKLREEREKKNLSISDISKATLIMPHYIEQIESDNFPRFDGYIAVYIRKYADLLGLDGKSFLEEYKALFENIQEVPPKRKKSIFILIPILLIVFIFSFIFLRNSPLLKKNNALTPSEVETPAEETPQEENKPTEEVEIQQPEVTNPEEEVKPSGVEVILTSNGLCWLGVEIDGKYTQQYIHKGETLTFKGQQYVKIRYGNATVVKVTVNGKDFGIVDPKTFVVDKIYKP